MKVGKVLDFLKGEALNFVFQNLGGAPSTPVPGQAWFNTATGRLEIRGTSAPYDPTDRGSHSGTQAASTIDSTFDTRVRTSRLDQMAVPTAPVSLNSQKITSLANGSAANDAIAYGQLSGWRLDQVAAPNAAVSMNSQRITNVGAPSAGTDVARLADLQGVQTRMIQKDPARVTPTGNVNVAAPGATHDGVTLTSGVDRILLRLQSTGSENGLYLFNGAASPLTRTSDAVTGTLLSGTLVPVLEGTANADTAWQLTTDGVITVGTTAQTWGPFAKPFVPVQGPGIQVSGSTISADVVTVHGRVGAVVATADDYSTDLIKSTYTSPLGFSTPGQLLTAVLGGINNAIAARVPGTRTITTAVGSYLTGGGDLTANRSLAVDAVTTGGTAGQAAKIPATGAGGKLDVSFLTGVLNGTDVVNSVATGTLGTTIASALTYLNNNLGLGAPKKYVETLATSAASYVVTHNLGSKDLVGQVREVATDEVVLADIVMTSTTTATVSFTTAQAAGSHRVVFIG